MENRKWSTGSEDGHHASRLMSDWDLRNQSEMYKTDTNGAGRWTIWYKPEQELIERKTIVLDGNRFSDLDSFYKEIDLLFRKNPEREIRHNFSTLHDMLRGGSRVLKFREPVKLVWKNSTKSMQDLGLKAVNMWAIGESFFEVLIDIIGEHKHIELVLE